MDDKHYFAVVGCKNSDTMRLLKPGMSVLLIKEPDNESDQEAIMVFSVIKDKIGYIANSTHAVPRGCCSAGRLYDFFKDHAGGTIRFVMNGMAIAEFSKRIPFTSKECIINHRDNTCIDYIVDESLFEKSFM